MRIFLSLVTLLFLSLPSWAAPPEGVIKAYEELADAWTSMDSKGILKLFAGDAKILDGRGKLLEGQSLTDTIVAALEGARSCKINYHIEAYENKDSKTFFARCNQDREIDYGDKVVTPVSTREDSWELRPEGWRIVYVKFITQNVSVEAKLERHKDKENK